MKDWKTETITIQEMTMTQRTSRQKQRVARQRRTTLRQKQKAARQRRTTARADNLATEAKGGKARTEENSNKSEAAKEMINEQGREFPFAMGRQIPRNEVKMIISQRTETGIQTSETGHEMGEQWESHWRNTNWGKRFDYWGVGKQKIPMSLRARRSQHWCRTEDVRTIKEGDMNTDRWKIETPPGIGNEEERSQKEVAHGKQECNEDKLETRVMRLEEQTKWMYDRMTAAAEPSTWNRGIPWRYEDDGDEWQRWEGSWWIRVNHDDLNSRQRRQISRSLKKMIDREKNGMARLLQELKKGIRAEVDESRRGADTNSENNERSRDDDEDCTTYRVRIPLVL